MKALKLIALGLLAAAVLLYLVVPIGFGAFASLRHPARAGDPPPGFSRVILSASDGVKLKAWYAPSTNGAVIIVVHGGSGSRKGTRSHTALLARNGFGVLALDLRGHGESEGRGNAFGWDCGLDIAAAVDFLSRQNHAKAIGGLGVSLGGELLLGTISERPEIRAVVSDGATFRSAGDYLVIPSRRSLARRWTTCLMYASTEFFTGQAPPRTIIESVAGASGTSLLLIAAGDEADEILYGQRFLEAAGGRAEFWAVPGAGHTEAIRIRPGEYEQRVSQFFESALLSPKQSRP